MAKITIYVTGYKPGDGEYDYLYLSHAATGSGVIDTEFVTDAKPGDTVTWVLRDSCSVERITGIQEKGITPQINLFSSGPSPNADGSWSGEITTDVQEVRTEQYFISFVLEGETKVRKDDPKIRVQPPD